MIVVRDKEKTRLSLLEEKLSDALSLLLQLRNKVCASSATLPSLTAPPSGQCMYLHFQTSPINQRRLTCKFGSEFHAHLLFYLLYQTSISL